MLMRFRTKISNVSGITSLIIFSAVILRLFGAKAAVRLFQLTGAVNLIWFTIIAVVLALICLSTFRGYRRVPFYLSACTGYFLILISLDLKENFLTQILSNDGFNLAAGVVLLVIARYVAGKSYFNHRRFIKILFPLTAAFLIVVNMPGVVRFSEELRYWGEVVLKKCSQKCSQFTSLLFILLIP